MSRPATILILIAMLVTAGSLAVVLNIWFGFPLAQALVLSVGALIVLMIAHVQFERRRDRREMDARVAELSIAINDEVDRIALRVVKLDQNVTARIRDEHEPLAAEVEVLGHLMKQVAEAVAEIETRIDSRLDKITAANEAARLAPPPAPAAPSPGQSPSAQAAEAVRIQVMRVDTLPPRPPEPSRIPSAFDREVEAAIRAERIEIHLQPVVTLPQRKVRFYEVLTRLRGNDGRLIPASEFIETAETRRVISKLDTYQVIRSFQILKRLAARNNEIGLFVNVSMISLADSVFFREFQSFLSQMRPMADLVQFEFKQDFVRDMGPVEVESLRAVAALGFRFSVDNITDLKMDFRSLADDGFRTAKISADRLLGRVPMQTGDIHPADLSGHLSRQGITLVVDKIETESQVIDLLDYEVRFAQGHLFSAPRQVRPEILGQAAAADAPRPAATFGKA